MTSEPLVVLPDALAPSIAALAALIDPDVPPIAIVGGTGVNIRLSTIDVPHRATQDIDVVAAAAVPSAIDVLARANERIREHTVVANGIEIDVIETDSFADEDLAGIPDGDRLFVLGHRLALDSATVVRLTTRSAMSTEVAVPVAAPTGLVATKSHAVGHPRSGRRATKHGSDLYDLVRLVDVFDVGGEVSATLRASRGDVARLVAEVVEREVLDSLASATRVMSSVAAQPMDVDDVREVMAAFVDELVRG